MKNNSERLKEIIELCRRGSAKKFESKIKNFNKKVLVSCETCTGKTILHILSKRLMPSCVEKMIKFGANVNSKDKNGNTPLHVISKEYEKLLLSDKIKGDIEKEKIKVEKIYKMLIDNGADRLLLNKKNEEPKICSNIEGYKFHEILNKMKTKINRSDGRYWYG